MKNAQDAFKRGDRVQVNVNIPPGRERWVNGTVTAVPEYSPGYYVKPDGGKAEAFPASFLRKLFGGK